jgi:oxygen-independent coproporphyrinogen-3 oxidase
MDRVPGLPPEGEPAPADGSLPAAALAELAGSGLSWYLHVPFCRSRCGYCDFNTYTAAELGGGVSLAGWADTAIAEIRLARRVLGEIDTPAPTVFFGGGTPSMLPAADVSRVIHALGAEFGLQGGAEITLEANPDDLTDEVAHGLREAGVNRISLGMQSAVPATLAVLERTHRASDMPAVVRRIRAAGFDRLSVDLIYGTPGESEGDWDATMRAALALEPDHVSAYCLGIEEGTRLGALQRAGRLPPVDPDEAADRYLATDQFLGVHGLHWYEISNWAAPGQECRHNLVYWRGGSWWGVGPGAHSHVGGVRWWNLRHPRTWTAALVEGRSPAQAREVLDREQRAMERLMLGIRLAEGAPTAWLHGGTATAASWVAQGLAEWLEPDRRFRLTPQGRLLADGLALSALP